jgi:hypothetical protein
LIKEVLEARLSERASFGANNFILLSVTLKENEIRKEKKTHTQSH